MRLVTVPGVFAPRSDSHLLARQVAATARPGATVLDPFTGSGILAITAALAGARVTSVDVSRRAVACAWLNARLNGVRIGVHRGDMFAPVRDERFDLIVANPPYLPAASDGDPSGAARAWEAGENGRRLLDRLCREAADHLRSGGRLLLVHSSICGPDATAAMLAARGLEVEVVARQRGPLGPLMLARSALLERRGLLAPGERQEDVLVFSALRSQRGVTATGSG